MGSAMSDFTNYDAIIEAIEAYIDGAKTGRGADMQRAFHEDAIIFGFADGSKFAGPIKMLFDSVDQEPPATGLKARFARIDIVGTMHKFGLNSTKTSRRHPAAARPTLHSTYPQLPHRRGNPCLRLQRQEYWKRDPQTFRRLHRCGRIADIGAGETLMQWRASEGFIPHEPKSRRALRAAG